MFSKSTKIFALSCLVFLFSLTAHAQSFNKMVVFGDSLSDNGNFYAQTEGSIPAAPYYQGRFSDGPVWVEVLAKELNLDTKNTQQFTDYAFALAWAADTNDEGSGGLVPLSWEIKQYMENDATHGADAKDTLYVIWIGSNDYLKDRSDENDHVMVSNAINDIQKGIHRLIANGAKHFLILNLPDLGQTPAAKQAGPAEAAHLTALAQQHNKALSAILRDEKAAHQDVQFIEFDLAAYFDDLVHHPEKYNMSNVTTPCFAKGLGSTDTTPPQTVQIGNKRIELKNHSAFQTMQRLAGSNKQQEQDVCSTPSTFLFWDYVHPTSTAHGLIAKFIAEELNHLKS